MNEKEFESVVEAEIGRIESTLVKKGGEYNLEEDRLGFFKRAAAMRGIEPKEALFGFMLKHLVSLSDMAQDGKRRPIALWREKMTDVHDYLILLAALLEEEEKE